MKKLKGKYGAIVLASMMAVVSACDDENTSEFIVDPVDYTSTAITGFSLRSNASVLNNLDSVYFAIDLNNAQIFNADSLPYGTDVSAVGVVITSQASVIKAYSPKVDGSGETTVVNLTDDETAKLNFSEGPVRFLVTSQDGIHTREYTVGVNVHKVVPDSLYWSLLARTDLPGSIAQPVAQKTVRYNDKAYCLTTDGSTYSLAVTSNPFENEWQTEAVTFGTDVKVETFAATTEAMYILATDGTLLTSADGTAWSATPMKWDNIIAPYANQIFGIIKGASGNTFATYPASTEAALPDDFPVADYSGSVEFESKWAVDEQILIFGGTLADGRLTGATWAFDGTSWAKLAESLPAAAGYSVAAYEVCETDTMSWRVSERNVLLAFGGRKADGSINGDVYMSRDLGLTWKKGDEYLQLPDYVPAVYGADIMVFSTVMNEDQSASQGVRRKAAKMWLEMPVASLPSIYAMPGWRSRATQPITQWECPFLYMFGGHEADGRLQNAVWRGVVNHFTFRPLQ